VIAFWLLIAVAVAMTAAQELFPGNPLFHKGWYNVLDAALLIIAAYRPRKDLIALGGAAMIVLAGVASGLMGPDTHTVVGSPGATVADDQIGASFVFPLAQPRDDPRTITVALQSGSSLVSIGASRRYFGGLVLWQTPRAAVWVSAADPAGNRLTITQPTNGSFLSPVLSMQQTTTIAGMNVRYDTFAVPALRRTVKAVLFTAGQAARLGPQAPPPGTPAVLFAVADRQDRPVPGGIGIVASGSQKTIGGLRLRGEVGDYPAVNVASAPYLPVLIVGGLILLAGAARTAFRSKT
jgi:hypothetical protein